jgi:hypothetical protein
MGTGGAASGHGGRGHRPPPSDRRRGAASTGPEGRLGLAAGGTRCAPGRAESAAALRAMGGKSEATWQAHSVPPRSMARGRQSSRSTDGAAGRKKAPAALVPAMPAQRHTAHRHRGPQGHTPTRRHAEASAADTDMIRSRTTEEIAARRRGVAAPVAGAVPGPADHPAGPASPRAKPSEADGPPRSSSDAEGHRRSALGRNRGLSALGSACLRADHPAQGPWLAEPRSATGRTGLTSPPEGRPPPAKAPITTSNTLATRPFMECGAGRCSAPSASRVRLLRSIMVPQADISAQMSSRALLSQV